MRRFSSWRERHLVRPLPERGSVHVVHWPQRCGGRAGLCDRLHPSQPWYLYAHRCGDTSGHSRFSHSCLSYQISHPFTETCQTHYLLAFIAIMRTKSPKKYDCVHFADGQLQKQYDCLWLELWFWNRFRRPPPLFSWALCHLLLIHEGWTLLTKETHGYGIQLFHISLVEVAPRRLSTGMFLRIFPYVLHFVKVYSSNQDKLCGPFELNVLQC